ncbi:hypothetical protein QOZ80_1BG0069320 [Eleusine coracana subsp. coracana]|nr:hypothetical protein QOZ80_1BG0069320 [Eleusine coracana subsp. coracana]
MPGISSSMAARLLRRSTLAAALDLGSAYQPRPLSGLFLGSARPSAAGHLGLVRARPGLLDLNRLLDCESFLLDATHALGCAALRHKPFSGNDARTLRSVVPQAAAAAEALGDTTSVFAGGMFMALHDASEGRLGDALDALERLATKGPPYHPVPRICDLLGRTDEADRWLTAITTEYPVREHISYQNTLVAGTLGGAPGAVAGCQGAVASAALKFIYEKLWGKAFEGHTPVAKKVLITALLNRVVRTRLNKGAVVDLSSVAKLLRSGSTGRVEPGYDDPVFAYPGGTEHFVLQASQALLSAVVLRAPPLNADRIRAATRAAERDLARAVATGDAGAAADLRLLLAFLAVRDGRFQEAGDRYVEAAREHPSDPRPHCLVRLMLLFDEQTKVADQWEASYQHLAAGSSEEDRVAHQSLKEELVIALGLGGARTAFKESSPNLLREMVGAAGSRVDAALLDALQDKETPFVQRLELRAIRALVYAEMWSAVKDLEMDGASAGKTD